MSALYRRHQGRQTKGSTVKSLGTETIGIRTHKVIGLRTHRSAGSGHRDQRGRDAEVSRVGTQRSARSGHISGGRGAEVSEVGTQRSARSGHRSAGSETEVSRVGAQRSAGRDTEVSEVRTQRSAGSRARIFPLEHFQGSQPSVTSETAVVASRSHINGSKYYPRCADHF